ncbi:MAG: hypothetical protein MK052_01285 [Alphaproteobacteria bacterium]|nr:hypothetical protein [Alphaproteobacteria bacterium]
MNKEKKSLCLKKHLPSFIAAAVLGAAVVLVSLMLNDKRLGDDMNTYKQQLSAHVEALDEGTETKATDVSYNNKKFEEVSKIGIETATALYEHGEWYATRVNAVVPHINVNDAVSDEKVSVINQKLRQMKEDVDTYEKNFNSIVDISLNKTKALVDNPADEKVIEESFMRTSHDTRMTMKRFFDNQRAIVKSLLGIISYINTYAMGVKDYQPLFETEEQVAHYGALHEHLAQLTEEESQLSQRILELQKAFFEVN